MKVLLQKDLGDQVQCNICVRRCKIPKRPGTSGFCGAYSVNHSGVLEARIFGYVPIRYKESLNRLPVFGFRDPATEVLSLGSIGCNFRCPWCWNAPFSWKRPEGVDPAQIERDSLTPEQAVGLAQKLGVKGIAFGYTEPTVQLGWVLKVSRLAKDAGLFTVWVTNGSATSQALELATPFLDVFRVGIKGPQEVYNLVAPGGAQLDEVLAATEYAYERGVWVEVVVSVVPGLSDSETWFAEIASWVKEELGPEAPLHFEPIYPARWWRRLPPSRQTIEQAVTVARDVGLKKVYVYDIGGGK